MAEPAAAECHRRPQLTPDGEGKALLCSASLHHRGREVQPCCCLDRSLLLTAPRSIVTAAVKPYRRRTRMESDEDERWTFMPFTTASARMEKRYARRFCYGCILRWKTMYTFHLGDGRRHPSSHTAPPKLAGPSHHAGAAAAALTLECRRMLQPHHCPLPLRLRRARGRHATIVRRTGEDDGQVRAAETLCYRRTPMPCWLKEEIRGRSAATPHLRRENRYVAITVHHHCRCSVLPILTSSMISEGERKSPVAASTCREGEKTLRWRGPCYVAEKGTTFAVKKKRSARNRGNRR
nr:hypothetical protein Iba_chr11bCG13650 [Ipomoea batatas]